MQRLSIGPLTVLAMSRELFVVRARTIRAHQLMPLFLVTNANGYDGYADHRRCSPERTYEAAFIPKMLHARAFTVDAADAFVTEVSKAVDDVAQTLAP